MILFFDEDMGIVIPKFLRGADEEVDVLWLRARFPNEGDPRRQDVGWLVISCNKNMLDVEFERQAILDHRVGIVFFASGQIGRLAMMRAILNKWDWLKAVASTGSRPFVHYLYAHGRTREISL